MGPGGLMFAVRTQAADDPLASQTIQTLASTGKIAPSSLHYSPLSPSRLATFTFCSYIPIPLSNARKLHQSEHCNILKIFPFRNI